MIKLILIATLSLFLSACASQNKPTTLLPPLKYQGNLSVHVPKKAYLFWQHGQEQAGSVSSFHGTGMEGMIGSIIEAQDRRNNPSKYYLTYGKAEQASFITNFRDALALQHVFKDIEIITNPNQVKSDNVLIVIKFKSTRVGGAHRNHKITLIVEMNIKSGNRIFTRTYLTESDEGTIFIGNSYDEQLRDASQQMLNQLMKGIKQWSHTYK